MKYEPIYNENSDELINDIREYIGKTNNDITNIDTLDICHLLGKIDNLNNIINETRRILGEYRHYSLPDEQQNAKNEAIVDEAYNQLHSNLKSLKEGK